MTPLLLVVAAVYGLVIGSFLNVVIYRVPAKQSIAKPPSTCPGCGNRIASRDNIPLVSWLLLRGRCRHCSMRISVRYPLVEVLTAALFVVVALRFGWSWTLPAQLFFVAGLVALAFTDLDHMRLPKSIVYTTGALVAASLLLAAAINGQWHRLWIAIICAAVELSLIFAIWWVSRGGAMGYGDIRLGALIALALGWIAWYSRFITSASAYT